MADDLAAARAAYARRDWGAARQGFLAARGVSALAPADLAMLADAAWWLGDSDDAAAWSEAAYEAHLEVGSRAAAAGLALEIGFLWALRGEVTRGSGWLARARRLLDQLPECVQHGYLAALEVDELTSQGDYAAAIERARGIQELGRRHADPTATALGQVGEGVALVHQGRVVEGTAVLDEAMLPVVSGTVEPGWAGNIYCTLMALFVELDDRQRAREWTAATERWCAGLASAVMFVGICRVHRAQLLQAGGDWPRAEHEAETAQRELAAMNVSVVAEANYRIAEVRRLRGDLDDAAEAYQAAHQLGRDPHPGLALLHLAAGQPAAAAEAIEGALRTCGAGPLGRARLLAAQAEIALHTGDAASARTAADELHDIATAYGSSGLLATAARAAGTAALAAGDAEAALVPLREACLRSRALEAPHDVACVRLLLARAHQQLGDDDGARRELDAAEEVLTELGAVPDLAQVQRLRAGRRRGVLTERETEVLVAVASGRSNREVAALLHLSEKTVARHLSNIFTKLGVSSRTEAAAHAFARGLVRPARG